MAPAAPTLGKCGLEGKKPNPDLPRLIGGILLKPGSVPGRSRPGDSLRGLSGEGKLCVSGNQSLGLWLLVLRDKVIMLIW